MKQRRRTEWAARLVQRAYRGWKRRRFLLRLAHHLPPESPLSREWPRAPPPCQHTSALLYKLYHKWRVSVQTLPQVAGEFTNFTTSGR